jgi:hypothetical protein
MASPDTTELLDMNGDGLPDRVVAGQAGACHLTVSYNTGSGFAGDQLQRALARCGRRQTTRPAVSGCTDVNGDGLPDHVLA